MSIGKKLIKIFLRIVPMFTHKKVILFGEYGVNG